MIIIRMTGGMGNQMFQYALYLKLCSMGREVKFDDRSEYELREARPIMLWSFGLNDYPKATKEEINTITDGFLKLSHRIRRKLFGRKSLEYQEKDCNFDPAILEKETAYLTGYFQTEQYFKEIEEQVRNAFTFQPVIFEGLSKELHKEVLSYQEKIENCYAVSIHIRRGDYLESSEVYGGNCTESYYESAISLITEKFPEAVFFVFSNEESWSKDWCSKQEKKWGRSFVNIEGLPEEKGYLAMMLMSKCRSHIIANSSFSWWGAWLNPDKEKCVIAPAGWFNNQECRDIYTKEMIRVPAEGNRYEKQLVSVIVTAYNIEEYLPRCMESLLRQTYEPLEIILVDDGSTDKTAEICDDYEKRYENIRVIHQKNSGPSAARNAGVRISNGEFIGYVDGDDWVEPDMYEKMRKACVTTGAQIAVCTYRQVGEGGEEIHPTGNVITLTKEEALEWYISGHEQYHIYHSVWSKLFKKSVIEEISFPEGHKSEDIMYTTWALAKAEKCVFLDTPYYNYMMDRSTSIMNTYLHERRFGDEIPFWKEQIGYLNEIGMTELSEKAYYQFCRRMLYYYIDFRNKKMKDSGRELSRMLKGEKEKIKAVYGKSFAATGDRVRIKLFLLSPICYYGIVKFYDKVVIPLRQKK